MGWRGGQRGGLPRHQRDERGEARDVQNTKSVRGEEKKRGNRSTRRWMQMPSLNNGVKCGGNEKALAVDEETIKRRSFHSAALPGESDERVARSEDTRFNKSSQRRFY